MEDSYNAEAEKDNEVELVFPESAPEDNDKWIKKGPAGDMRARGRPLSNFKQNAWI